MIKKRRRF